MPKYEKESSAELFKAFIAQHQDKYLHLLTLLNKALAADYLFLASVHAEQNTAQTCLVLQSGRLAGDFSYSLHGSPCEHVLNDNTCLVTDNVLELYPQDELLKEMHVDAYMGFPIRCGDKTVGLLVAMNQTGSTVFHHHQFVAEMFAEQLSARLTSEWHVNQLNAYQQLFDEVCAISEMGAWEYQLQTKQLYWSDEVYRIYGIAADASLTPELAMAFYADADRDRIALLFQAAVTDGAGYVANLQFADAQGNKKWVRTSCKVEQDSSGQAVRLYGAIEDITAEYERLEAEQQQRTYLKGVLDSLNDAVVTIDMHGNIVGINQRTEAMFGYAEHEITGLKINALMPEPYASQHDGYMRHFHQTGNAKIIGVGRQLPAKRKNGDVFQMELALSQYKYDGNMYFIGIVRDITKRIEANDTIYKLAFIDSITGLKNKASFEQELKDLLARSAITEHYLYAAYIDIDGLARYNLTYGTAVANQLMALISQRLEATIGNRFKIFKFGSDEFIVLSNHSLPAHALGEFQYEALEAKLRDPQLYDVTLKDERVSVTVSMASMVVQAKSLTLETLVDSLEYAMRRAKRYKPFGHFFLGPLAVEEYERAKLIKRCVHDALQSDEFHLVLQPQFKYQHQFFASEALIRWTSKELGFISPAEFIPLAEESDDIILIGDWVIDKVCQLLGGLAKDGIYTRIAINISSKQMVQPDFEKKLHAATEKYAVSPDALMLELTETTLVSDIELVKRKMLALAQSGFVFSVDDFGTGYSSLSYIKELPISELKIDKYFVDGIGHEDGFAATNIVNVVIDMAKALDLEVVAEGVETQAQCDYLQKRGCDAIQGYLLSKPLSVDDWLNKLQAQVVSAGSCTARLNCDG